MVSIPKEELRACAMLGYSIPLLDLITVYKLRATKIRRFARRMAHARKVSFWIHFAAVAFTS